jgi:NAD(P)-dependent dehydrogenase (short-subunit alcohol dehydrogenase family)
MTNHHRLTGRTALVTGAAQNIGRGIATRFAAEGARVVVVDRQQAAAAEVAAAIGGEAIAADLTNVAACHQVVAEAERRVGGIDILVNNAYAGTDAPLTEQDDAVWETSLAIGLTAMMALCRACLGGMCARGRGSIINLSSINAFAPALGMPAYAAVKGGIVSFTRQIAVEYGPHGVRANSLCPGHILNERFRTLFAADPVESARFMSAIPLRRSGTNDDCASAAVFLASDEASFITGHSLVVDGGQTAQSARVRSYAFAEALRAQEQP